LPGWQVFVVEMLDTDISAYTYERTRQMEERQRLMRALKLTKKERLRTPEHTVLPQRGGWDGAELGEDSDVRRMNTSVKLNKIIREHSMVRAPGRDMVWHGVAWCGDDVITSGRWHMGRVGRI